MTATFVLLAYNQEDYVTEAVHAALAQTGDPLEILISDDASTDETFARIEAAVKGYAGPHRVLVNRNPVNLGVCEHINRAMSLTSGDPVIVAAADDLSRPDRAEILCNAMALTGGLLAHSDVVPIGHPTDIETFDRSVRPGILLMRDWTLPACCLSMSLYIGATGAWRRTLFDEFGRLPVRDCYEDLVLGFRAALLDKVTFVREPLVAYRVGQGLSTPKTAHADYDGFLRARLRDLVRERATLSQRIKDASRAGLPEDNHVIDLMRKRLAAIDTTEDALSHSFWRFMARQRRDPVSAYLKYRRIRRQSLRRYRSLMGVRTN